MKIMIVLISVFYLASCVNVPYQQRDEFTPNGYSETHIEDNLYKVSYETYKLKGTEPLLTNMAKYRAAELTLAKNKTYFDIISVNFTEGLEDYTVPEQKIRLSYGGGTAEGDANIQTPIYIEETVIPEHIRQFKIKRVEMRINILEAKKNDQSVLAQSVIEELSFR